LFGVTPAEAARPCGTVKATFRAQLRAAYAKLGINGRDELATF
jgi:DNA-binding CsgD family transcriptional regulator